MVAIGIAETLRLAGHALGALGAGLLFIEFFQLPSYVSYNEAVDGYTVQMNPNEVTQYTWIGRAGALGLAVGFALQFLATLLG